MAATPETKVKDYLRDELKHLAESTDVPIRVIANAAGAFTDAGRTDVDILLGGRILLCAEIKAEGGDLEPHQSENIRDGLETGQIVMVIEGMDGVDTAIDMLREICEHQAQEYVSSILSTMQKFVQGFDAYDTERKKRKAARLSRPKRQSSDI